LARIFARVTPDHPKNTSLCPSRSSRWCRNPWICARVIFCPIYLRRYSFCRANCCHTLNTDVRQCDQYHTDIASIDCKMSPPRNGSCLYDGSGRTLIARIFDSQESDETPAPSHIFWTCWILYYTPWVFL